MPTFSEAFSTLSPSYRNFIKYSLFKIFTSFSTVLILRFSSSTPIDLLIGIFSGRDIKFTNATNSIKSLVKDYNNQAAKFIDAGDPVISVDAKKKELIGDYKNSGRTWRPKGQPELVNVYDFPSKAIGAAIPYGIYDLKRNKGVVNVGKSHNTAEFAVESIRQWWNLVGKYHYVDSKNLLICADGGGSNGSRNRGWKFFLQHLADEIGVTITVCHFPPGTSKWNKIEHCMFSFISMNWRGKPLSSYETIIKLIGSTKTKKGLKIEARLDERDYETGIKILDKDMSQLKISLHELYPNWNYSIEPRVTLSK
jgi:hypothetical protein